MALFRYVLWGAVFALGAFLAFQTAVWTFNQNSDNGSFGAASIGGAFEALRDDGTPITHDAMTGNPHLVFFGFTHCPDVCPTTLAEVGSWMDKLGPQGEDLRAWFVTVDPTRDTPESLSLYLSPFDTRIDGITGSQAQIDDMVRKWRVFAQRQETGDGDYTMNHTASTFLMKSDGTFFGTIAYGENADTAVKKLQRLIAADSAAKS
ncbi:MAG: SCO family protein [Ahrensia sp.]|nr:SCO family protein [Ahrensia sp.]